MFWTSCSVKEEFGFFSPGKEGPPSPPLVSL
jgi:hypothetical protein